MNSESIVFHNPVFDRIAGDKKEKIITIAVEEFADNGLAGTNINRIAERAEISIGSLYKYFPTKESLYLSVVNLCFEQLEKVLRPIMESESTLTDKIRAILDLLFLNADKYKSMNRLYNRFTSEGNSEMARTIAVRVETITAEAYASLLLKAKKEKIISEDIDERIFAFLIDNIFITIQFSLSSEYYTDRMKIYLGEKKASDYGHIQEQVFLFICRSLGLGHQEN